MKKITKNLIDDYIRASIDGSVVTGAPATLTQIEGVEREIGVKLPDELIDVYKIYNGIGMISKSGEKYWSFHPLEEIGQFMKSIRGYFLDTHPEDAIRFFPVYDWNSGDAIGYMLGASRNWEKGLFEFEHDNYESRDSQLASDFLSRCNRNLREFLKE